MSHSVLIVDDHPLLRRGLIQLLELESDLDSAGEASDGETGLRLARENRPDLILLDLNMRGLTGVETLRSMRAEGIEAPIVILTVSDSDDDIAAALRAGASGYLLKDMEPEALITQLHRALEGETVVSEGLTASLVRALNQEHPRHDAKLNRITARERDILRHLGRGESNKMIARNLGITEGTAKVHVRNLLKKLSFRSRLEAAVFAVQNNLT